MSALERGGEKAEELVREYNKIQWPKWLVFELEVALDSIALLMAVLFATMGPLIMTPLLLGVALSWRLFLLYPDQDKLKHLLDVFMIITTTFLLAEHFFL